jgi:hypothetical protein
VRQFENASAAFLSDISLMDKVGLRHNKKPGRPGDSLFEQLIRRCGDPDVKHKQSK